MSLLSFSLITVNENGLVCSVVSRFSRNLFFDFCGRSGLKYDAQVCDFDQISSILFKESVTWISCQVLFGAIYDVGSCHGCEPIKNGCKIMCSRVTRKKKSPSHVERDCHIERVSAKNNKVALSHWRWYPCVWKSTGMLNKDCSRRFFGMNRCISVNRAPFMGACANLHCKTLWMYDLLPVPTCGSCLTTPYIACVVSWIQVKGWM